MRKKKKTKTFHGEIISVGEDEFEILLERPGNTYIATVKNVALAGYEIKVGLKLDWVVEEDNIVNIVVKPDYKKPISDEELKKKINESVEKYGHFFK